MLGEIDVLAEPLHRLPEMHLLLLQRRVVLAEFVLALVQRVQDRVEVGLRALVAVEVVAELVAEGNEAEQLLDPGRLLRVEILDRPPQVEQACSTPSNPRRSRPCPSPSPGSRSIRLLTSEAARMSSSPIVRMLSAFAANSGVFVSSLTRLSTYSPAILSSPGSAAASSGHHARRGRRRDRGDRLRWRQGERRGSAGGASWRRGRADAGQSASSGRSRSAGRSSVPPQGLVSVAVVGASVEAV